VTRQDAQIPLGARELDLVDFFANQSPIWRHDLELKVGG
jgi:hypothetical protein